MKKTGRWSRLAKKLSSLVLAATLCTSAIPASASNLTGDPDSGPIVKADDMVLIDFTNEGIIDMLSGSASRYKIEYNTEGCIVTDITSDQSPHFGLVLPKEVQFSADEYKYMKIGYRTSAPTTQSALYWSSNDHIDLGSDDVNKYREFQIKNDGEWHGDVLHMTQANYSGNVQFLRFSPFEAGTLVKDESTIQVKYYAFFKDEYTAQTFDEDAVNVALNKGVTATHTYEEGYYGKDLLTDGLNDKFEDMHTSKCGWSTSPDDESAGENTQVDLTIDLGGVYGINAVKVFPMVQDQTYFPKAYSIYTSTDGNVWNKLADSPAEYDGTINPQVFAFAEADSRYVRISITKPGGLSEYGPGWLSQIGEVEVYGFYKGTGEAKINKKALRMNPGSTDKLKAVVDIPGFVPDVTWSSDDESVATIDADGKVTAVAYGETVLRGHESKLDQEFICNITVDDHNVLEKLMITTFRSPSKEHLNAESYDLLKDCYITNVQNEWNTGTNTEEDNMLMAQLAYERGMDVTVAETHWRDGFLNLTPEQIQERVEKYTHVPGVGGFYVLDEPADPNPYANAFKPIRDLMPNADVHLNLLPYYCYANYTVYEALQNDWVQTVKPENLGYLMYDFYPFTTEGTDYEEDPLLHNLESFRKVGLKTGVNTGAFVQSIGRYYPDDPGGEQGKGWYGLRIPSEGDLRLQVNYSLAYGMKQIGYFCWETPVYDAGTEQFSPALVDRYGKPTPLYYSACKINKAATMLGPTLMKLDAISVYLAGDQYDWTTPVPEDFFIQPEENAQLVVSYMRHRETGANYAMLVNRDNVNNYTTTFTVDSSIGAIEEISQETGELVPVEKNADGSYTITLLPGEGRLFKMPDGYDYTPGYGRYVQPESKTNLALDAVVGGSSSVGWTGNSYFSYAADGIRFGQGAYQGWQSKTASDSYLTVDLGGVATVNRVDLYPVGNAKSVGDAFPVDYTIDVSEDGEAWTTVATVHDQVQPKLSVPSFTFDAQKARYVRVNITGVRNGLAPQIGEVEVYNDDGTVPAPEDTPYSDGGFRPGANIAMNAAPIASSSNENGPWWLLSNINDGMNASDENAEKYPAGWCSALVERSDPNGEEWVGYNLGNPYTIDHLYVDYARPDCEYFPENWAVDVSDDGTSWTTVYTHEGLIENLPLRYKVTLDEPVQAQYVRFRGTKLTRPDEGSYWMQLSELEVYGTPVSDKTALSAALAEAAKLKEADYVPDSWSGLQKLVKEAQTFVDAQYPLQSDLDEYTELLNNAIENMVPMNPEKASLIETLKEARAINLKLFEEIGQNEFTAALHTANEIVNNPDATPEQITAADTALKAAMSKLIAKDFGANIAPGKTVIYSSENHDEPYWQAKLINDGFYSDKVEQGNAGWSSAVNAHDTADATEWVGYDLGGLYTLAQVIAYSAREPQAEYFPVDYCVEVSTDGTSWQKVAEVTNDQNYEKVGPRILIFDSVTARYVRFVGTKLTDNNGGGQFPLGYLMQLSELEVYGVPYSESTVDKAALNKKVAEAKEMVKDLAGYTEESVNDLKSAITAAEAVLGNTKATQDEVDAELAKLQAAIDGLQVSDTPVNLAPGRTVMYSSENHEEPYWQAKLINDGFYSDKVPQGNAGWSSAINAHTTADATEWIGYNLGKVYTLSKVMAYNAREPKAEYFPIDYHVEVSIDGQRWITVAEVTGDQTFETVGARTLTFDPVAAQYVRFVGTKLTDNPGSELKLGYLMQLSELEVFGVPYVAPTTDKTELRAATADAKAIDLSPCTAVSAEALKDAIAAAEAVLADDAATQDAVNTALEALNAAVEGLVENLSKVLLKDTIDAAELEKQSYPAYLIEAIKVKFEAALAEAWSVYQNTEATDEQIMAADDALINIMHYLKFTADPTGLQKAIEYAKGIAGSGKYVEDDKLKAYNDLIKSAEELLKDEYATDTEYEEKILALQDAEKELTVKPEIILNLRVLEHQLGLAEQIDLKDYLDGAAKEAFTAAYAKAQDVYKKALAKDESITQDDVDKAAKALHDALLDLRLVPSKDALEKLLSAANKLDLSKYTEASGAVLTAAVKAAQAVYDDPQADIDRVKGAERALQAAMAQLVPIKNSDDTPSGGGNPNEKPGEDVPTGDSATGNLAVGAMLLLSAGILMILKKGKNSLHN